MMTTNIDPGSKVTNFVFVHAYHSLPGISQGVWIDYYDPAAIQILRHYLKDYIQRQFDLFEQSWDYGEYFGVAEYDGVWDGLAEEEVEVFRLALGPENRIAPFEELHPIDSLKGFQAIMLHHIGDGDLVEIRRGLSLFNDIMVSALEAVDGRNPRSHITLLMTKEFGPWLIDRLLESVECLRQEWRSDDYDKLVGATFEPLKRLLEKLRLMVRREGWPRDELALGRFLLIVDYFKQEVEETDA